MIRAKWAPDFLACEGAVVHVANSLCETLTPLPNGYRFSKLGNADDCARAKLETGKAIQDPSCERMRVAIREDIVCSGNKIWAFKK